MAWHGGIAPWLAGRRSDTRVRRIQAPGPRDGRAVWQRMGTGPRCRSHYARDVPLYDKCRRTSRFSILVLKVGPTLLLGALDESLGQYCERQE